MTSIEVRLATENGLKNIQPSSTQRMLEIAKNLDKEFESSISKYSLKFKDPSSEQSYKEYFDYNCKISYHLLIILILIIEVTNLISEIFYLAFNLEKITSIMVLIFSLFKGIAIVLETISIFHHYNKIIYILCNCFIFISIAIGNIGIVYVDEIHGIEEIDRIDYFLIASVTIQFFIALYIRSQIFLNTIIYYLIGFLLWALLENIDMFLSPNYNLVKLPGFIILAFIGVFYTYYICKSKRRDYFFLNKIISELKNQKDLIEYIPMPLLISDNKDVLYINNPSINLFNLKKSQHFTKSEELKNIKLVEKDRNEEISLFNYLVQSNVEQSSTNVIFRIKNDNKDLEASKFPIIYNEARCWITCFREISEFIKKTQDQIQKKVELLVIGSITHNFRTPLNSILGISDLALTSSVPLPQLHQKYLQKINQQSLILFLLVDNIHEYFNFKNNRLEREDSMFNPIEEIKSILILLEDEINGKKIQISFNFQNDLEERLCNFVNDKIKYRLMIYASISNSIRYTINGFIEINIKYNENENYLVTIIEDNGENRPSESLDYLFQDLSSNQFEAPQFNQTAVEMGCGMTLMMTFSKVMGGKNFELNSKQDKGRILIFDIQNYYEDIAISPILENTPRSFLSSPKASSRQLLQRDLDGILISELEKVSQKFRILIVDDVDSNLFVFTNYCERIKLNYDLAHNGLEALKLYEKAIRTEPDYSYKVIFMDINMPIMDGLEATRKIREVEGKVIQLGPKVLIVGVTANMECSIKSEAIAAGMTKIHTKPFSFKDFKKCIELAFL